jgi:hypothetical protein
MLGAVKHLRHGKVFSKFQMGMFSKATRNRAIHWISFDAFLYLFLVLIYLFILFLIYHSFAGDCYSDEDKAGEILLQNISLLAGGNPFRHTKKSINPVCFGNFVAIESAGDMFAIQRAEVIHTICWFSSKYHRSDFVRYLL